MTSICMCVHIHGGEGKELLTVRAEVIHKNNLLYQKGWTSDEHAEAERERVLLDTALMFNVLRCVAEK